MKDKITLNKDNCKILICCHKPCELPPDPDGLFLLVQVGAAISDVDLGMQRDDQVNGEPCDNISAKNKSYCELTALYWAWKNIKKIYPNLEYIGLNHYRRYFSTKKLFSKFRFFKFSVFSFVKLICGKTVSLVFIPSKNISSKEIQKCNIDLKIFLEDKISKGKDVFSTEFVRLVCNDTENFFSIVGKNNIDFLETIIKKTEPKYFYHFQTLLRSKKFCYANMFVMSYENFNEYCRFMFSVLENFEKESAKQNFYKDILDEKCAYRLLGYLGELLTNTFMMSLPINKKEKLGVMFIK